MIMRVDELLSKFTPEQIIQELKKGRGTEVPDIKKYISAIDPQKHSIFDEVERPNKLIKNENGEIRTLVSCSFRGRRRNPLWYWFIV